jgi:ubiquinone/menaquinone biosynthesis C-methylase UbiE
MELAFDNVSKAFSKQAPKFDEEDFSNPILQWMRERVRAHVEQFLEPGNKILELNAGTGLDSVYYAQHGYKVHATDLSTEMVNAIETKICEQDLSEYLSVQQLSYTSLNRISSGPFDYVFSNFGGLNCQKDIGQVSESIKHTLTPGSYLTLVIMPPVCPWEIGSALKGNFKHAFRRLKPGGDMAHLEGERFMVYYFTPEGVQKAFGPDFKIVQIEGLATFCPPPHHKQLALKNPSIIKALTAVDERLCNIYPFSHWADHFIITLWYCPLL